MFTTLAFTALLAASGAMAAPQTADVIAPVTPASFTQCQPILLKWSGGKAPYYVSLIDGKAGPSGDTIVDFGKMEETQKTWLVVQPVDQSLTLKIVDSNGNSEFAAPVVVQKGANDECLKASGSADVPAPTGSDAPAGSDAPVSEGAATPATTDGAPATPSTAAPAPSATGASTPIAGTTSTGTKAPVASGASVAASGSSSASKAAASTAAPSSGAGRVVASTGVLAAAVFAVVSFL